MDRNRRKVAEVAEGGRKESFLRSAAALRATNPSSAPLPRRRAPRAQHCIRLPIFAVGNLRPAATAPLRPACGLHHLGPTLRPMSAIAPLISDLAIIPVAAGCSTLVFKGLRQPVILGYIVAGVLAGPFGIVHPDRLRCVEHPRVGRHRRHLPAFRHGTRILVPQTAERGRHGCHGRRDDRGGNDVRGYGTGMSLGFSHMSSIFLGGMLSMSSTAIVFKAFDDMGLRGQRFHGRGTGHPRGRGSGGRRADGAALDAGREQAVRRRRDAGQHPQTGSLPGLLVAAGHLPDPHAAQTAATAAQRRNAAHRGARPVSGDGDDRRQGRFLGCARRLRHGIAPGRNGRSRTDHTAGRTGQEPLRRDLLRLGRHDDRTGSARALRRPHRAAHGRGTSPDRRLSPRSAYSYRDNRCA